MDFVNKILQGHTLDVLKEMPDKVVDCAITSPPYWSLRDYQSEPIIWNGIDECEHEWGEQLQKKTSDNYNHGFNERWGNASGQRKQEASSYGEIKQGQFCIHCNAWLGQLGLEPTIELYVNHLLQIFSEVGRVMKDEGTLWVVLGDSYGGGGGDGYKKEGVKRSGPRGIDTRPTGIGSLNVSPSYNVTHKSLCFIPQRFAIGMIDNGFICRNVIIWKKPSCMPASVKDRFTVDFEYVYFFVKKQKYFFEQQFESHTSDWANAGGNIAGTGKHKYGDGYRDISDKPEVLLNPQGRNKRCVWSITTKPFSEAHFATFPPKLIETMIKAGCPEFVCKECGKGRKKIYDNVDERHWTERQKPSNKGMRLQETGERNDTGGDFKVALREYKGLSDCGCDAGWKPGIVLDPFMGAGTTGMVAKKLKRNYVGIELNDEYCKMAEKRIKKQPVAMFT